MAVPMRGGWMFSPNVVVNTANSDVLPSLSVAVSASCGGTLPIGALKLPMLGSVVSGTIDTVAVTLSRPWVSSVCGLVVKIWMLQGCAQPDTAGLFGRMRILPESLPVGSICIRYGGSI